MDMRRAMMLQHPYEVASSSVGNSSWLSRYAISNAHTTPRLVSSISEAVITTCSYEGSSPAPLAANSRQKVDITTSEQLSTSPYLKDINLVMNRQSKLATNSATSIDNDMT